MAYRPVNPEAAEYAIQYIDELAREDPRKARMIADSLLVAVETESSIEYKTITQVARDYASVIGRVAGEGIAKRLKKKP